MPDAACRYSSSELELCGLKKSLLHFQYLLKYSTFTVLMDQCLKTHLLFLQTYENCPYSELFGGNFRLFNRFPAHLWKTHVCIRLLTCFSSDNKDEDPIPYLTDTTLLDDASYMSQLDAICQFNYDTFQGICRSHSFPLTRFQAKLKK